MLHSWFGSKSSRRQTSPSLLRAPDNAHSDASSAVSPSLQTVPSDAPLDELHAHINDPSAYARTPSLIHSADKEPGTPRTSDLPAPSLGSPTSYPRPTTPISKRASAPDRLQAAPFTPQDTVLAQVFGKSAPPTDAASTSVTPSAPSGPALPSVSLTTRTSDSAPPPPVLPALAVFDPFSGARLGDGAVPTADGDRTLWSSLERILALQAEIAAMHADMEGVGRAAPGAGVPMAPRAGGGGRPGPARRRSRRGQTLPIGDEEPEEPVAGIAASEISTDHSEGEEEGEEDDEDDVRGYGKRRRDEEFARLAEQFKQRKAAIGGIMNKLDDLSTALKTFHALPPPLFDLPVSPSRTDTLSSVPSNASAPPSPSPLQLHPGRSSSPLSSISPSQTRPITPLNVALSPPIPPIPTLAPPVPSEDPDSPPELGAVVAPALPRIASPRILPGAPHVESPADMNPTQSIFRGVL